MNRDLSDGERSPWIERRRVAKPESGATRVLICGDQPLYRSALASLIERNPQFRTAAESTTDISEVANALANDVDMVLIDVDLLAQPRASLASLERLLETVAPRPTLIVSAGFDPEACQAVLRHGISGIVLKASGGDVLNSAMERALRGHVWLDRDVLTEMFDTTQRRKNVRGEQSKIDQLTPREREIVEVACTGVSNKQIAQTLEISEATVRHHLGSIFSKLGVSTRSELVVYSYRNKLADPAQ